MKHVDVILGHNVEYNASMSRLPILVLEKEATWRGGGGMPEGLEIWLFHGANADEIA